MESGSVSSIPSSTISNSSARSTPTPSTYKPITQSASLLALTKTTDDDLRRRSPDELLRIVRRFESENHSIVAEHSSIVKDVNKRMQILLLEVRGLKDINQNLQDDNQELRDLCCFLDDDRQRGRKLAREWQRFGRYTASVMRSEVSAYQEKLKELETKQQELIADNLDLKELCLYLDQERLRASQPRDDGDGSSSSTIAGNEEQQQNDIELVPVNQLHNTNNIDNDAGTNEYIRQLEEKVRQLEKEKKKVSKQTTRVIDNQSKETPHAQVTGTQRIGPDGTQSMSSNGGGGTSPNKPEAVVHAMKVLEVHENLERPHTAVGEENALDDKEKAIVREMCNVVWRKLGNVKAEQQEAQQAMQPPVYENLQPIRSKSTPPESTEKGHPMVPPEDRYSSGPEQGLRSSTELLGPGPARGPGVAPQGPFIQKSDNSRGHTVFQVAPSYPVEDSRRPNEYQGQYQGMNAPTPKSQRPPPQSQSQPPNAHYTSQQSRYGHVQTSRSTPVTPTPQQQSQHPATGQRMEPKSHSPGPVRRSMTPRVADMHRSQSPGPKPRSQYPRSDSQSSAIQNPSVYQNQPPPGGGRGDNSYENVPSDYYYTSQPSQGYSSQGRSHDPGNSNYEYQAPPPQSYSQSSYADYSSGKGSRPPNPYHASTPSHSNKQQPVSSSQSPPYYQNIPMRNPTPGKANIREPSPQGSRYPPQHAPPTLPHNQYSSHRNPPSSHSYSQPSQPQTPQPSYPPSSHTSYSSSGYSSQPPAYNAPPQYQDRRTSYIEARDNNQPPFDERRNFDKYYNK